MQVRWRVDHAPLAASESRVEAPDIAGGDRYTSIGTEIGGGLGDEQIRACEMLDDIPQDDQVERVVEARFEIITGRRGNAADLACVLDGALRDVDAHRGTDVRQYLLEKEA